MQPKIIKSAQIQFQSIEISSKASKATQNHRNQLKSSSKWWKSARIQLKFHQISSNPARISSKSDQIQFKFHQNQIKSSLNIYIKFKERISFHVHTFSWYRGTFINIRFLSENRYFGWTRYNKVLECLKISQSVSQLVKLRANGFPEVIARGKKPISGLCGGFGS